MNDTPRAPNHRRPGRPDGKAPRKAGGSRPAQTPGLAVRRAAVDAIDAVLDKGRPLEEALDRLTRDLDERDRSLARMIAATSLRRLGSLRALLRGMVERGLPEKARRVETLLVVGAAQILLTEVPDHAAVATSVALAGEDPASAGFKGLVNAVLRRVAREGKDALPEGPDQPGWMVEGWREAYGPQEGAAISKALAHEAGLDLTAHTDAAVWAQTLGGRLLPTGTIRLVDAGNVTALPGFAEGAWWVQDAAAALPARLLHPAPGMTIADLCAAPGGKTAQLAAAGGEVTAVDRSGQRLKRLKQNLDRLGLSAAIVEADAASFAGGPFDAVLIDAPCSATGTIRRHPDVAWSKRPEDVAALAGLQARILARGAELVRPGGMLVYSTCSLEPEEGERQVEALLAARPDFRREPIGPGECGIPAEWINAAGELRTLPTHLPDADPRQAGLDGFFAARLRRA
ncbi:16S rRNA (cytosine(967)-C(5))-methyltransferase RsmB [Ancylobacter mangrovi]|uniref:16S rRNA (cytosine(967)-C(5))-methyltransferase RsmB n=1 Tax=Ancylobacter mangrovi TaxID=2972472 RepID=UPI0021625379|nr:16S rRNA (cytosine(967)-C(5))-methyltransferase RsmB [Ancylobacter mangrovi]MCS0504035.1 16S rRNA (cytosine(967)-C(5))-methyltransferase RsmB [Ancylobacter mangrovi]